MPPDSEWQTASLTTKYLSGVRGAIPCAEKQIEALLHIARIANIHLERGYCA